MRVIDDAAGDQPETMRHDVPGYPPAPGFSEKIDSFAAAPFMMSALSGGDLFSYTRGQMPE
jgi:hypothetical protein